MNKLVGWFYKIKYGVSNLIKWFPIVWKDRNWDHYYIDAILHFKLRNAYKALVGSNVDWKMHKKDLQALRICISILDRRLNDWHYNVSNLPTKLIEPKMQTEFNLFIKLYAKYQETWWC